MIRGCREDLKDWCINVGGLYLLALVLVSVVLGVCCLSDQCAVSRSSRTTTVGEESAADAHDTLGTVGKFRVRADI
jgi:hypothetical protein